MPEDKSESQPAPAKGTIIWTEAGNVSYVKGLAPVDIEPLLAEAIRDGTPFVYLHSEGQQPNSLAVAPSHVTALVRAD
jgi:hypothetical protein